MAEIVSTIKRMMPKSIKKVIHKLQGKSTKRSIKRISGATLAKEAKSYQSNFTRKMDYKITGNISKKQNMVVESEAIDYAIEKKLRSDKYTFNNMLLITDPYQMAPLTALAVFKAGEECTAKFTVKGDTPEHDVTGTLDRAIYHRVPIFGLYADKENEVVIELFDKKNRLIDQRTIKITTKPLPEDMEGVIEVKKYSGNSAYGLTLVSGKSTPCPYAFDTAGVVRYYLNAKPRGYGLFPLANSHFIFIEKTVLFPTYEIPHSNQYYEMDFFGRVYRTYFTAKGAHHDVYEKVPDGNIMYISNSMEGHMEDVVTEQDRYTGEIVKELNLGDIFKDTYTDMIDWAHMNTVSYNPKYNSVLLSPRNLHSVISIDWATNELQWILGDPRFWEKTPFMDKVLKPTEEFQYFYQQHAAYELMEDLDGNPDTRHIILYDNHWHKRRKLKFFDQDEHSYAKIYTINTKDMTVRLEHKYQSVKSKITSNALLAWDKKRVFAMGAYLEPLIDDKQGMIYEYDYDTEEVLNQYAVKYYYYRAYEFWVNYQALATPMEKNENYAVGRLTELEEMTTDYVGCDTPVPEEIPIHYKRMEDVCYIETQDHKLTEVVFKGTNHSYRRDYSKAKPSTDIFLYMGYYVAMPLDRMKPDTYHIYITYDGVTYDTTKEIVVSEPTK